MEKIPERIARAEEQIAALKAADAKHETRLDVHDTSLHRHGRELQGITMTSEALKEGVDSLRGLVSDLPEKMADGIAEAIFPIRDIAQQTKEEFLKYKYMFWGGATIAGSLGGAILYLLYQIIKLKGIL